MSTLLAIIDVQHDFLPGGSLGVNDGNMVIPVINQIRNQFKLPTVFSKDYHPIDHISFQVNNPGSTLYKNHLVSTGEELTMWPVHCVQNTHGSEIHPDLIRTESDLIVHKGTDTNKECYSAFGSPELWAYCQKNNITKIVVTGIATDYCVKATALDAKNYGLDVIVVKSACRGVSDETTTQAIDEMIRTGIKVVDNVEDMTGLI